MRYLHTNLIARDWQRLAAFYERVLDCVRVLPERHLSGESMERGSGVAGARIDGHIAFEVDDVAPSRDAVVAAGGALLGTVESVAIQGAGRITWTFVRDPEGNIIELQRRDR